MKKIGFLHIAVFAVLLAACNGAATGGKASGGADSADVNWSDSCMAAYLHIQDHYLAGQYDSMQAEAPAVMELCRKHGEWTVYYNAWERLAERYVWEKEYERAAAEAEAMRTDAAQRGNDYGQAMAYYVLAQGYIVQDNHTEAASYGWHVCVNGHMEDNLAIYNPDTRNADELAIKGWLREEGASKLFSAAGMNMAEALAAAKRPDFKSFSLKVKGDVRMAVSYNIQQTRNVGAILRGTDKADEAVVMNAHWDHLGIGKPDEHGDSIYNGAADNASGMASALLVAKKFKALPQRPRRSVLFLFPSSEESGLFGSEYYCNHPVIPMEKTSACLNFESIGPAELTHDVVILGGGETDLDQYYVAAAATQGRTIFFDDDNSDGWFFRSDHYNFVKKGVRAVVVENGLKPVDPSRPNKYPMPVWYHKPSDEYHDDWDLSGTLANTNLIFSVGLSLVFIP